MRLSALTLAALATVACAKTDPANQTDTAVTQAAAGMSHDPAMVQRSIDSSLVIFTDAMKRSDVAGMSRILADDIIVLAPNAKVARGRAEAEQAYAAMFATVTVTAVSIKTSEAIITGDYAIETGVYDMTVQPKTGKPIHDVGKYLSVWKKQADGGWKLTRDIFNTDQAM